ncbi:hypothetical protein DFH07DRAFT_943110 [Mycena maculata]|uniref:EthD domain-containing protein n=1 Tax=Mycena maculata TaxID=230809 RepID=A0AAD7IIW4_9AGAR|nr:hypothetical protein DFH07DRAFT_943110 [Mycena maculata]
MSIDRARVIGIYKIPPNTSVSEFERKYEAMADAFVALPIARRNLVKHELSFATNACDDPLQTMKLPAQQGIVVVIAEAESHEKLMEYLNDPETQKITDTWRDEMGLAVEETSLTFHAKVITKLDK